MELLGHTLEFSGTLIIAYTVLSVHSKVRKEHKIDEAVFKQMRSEQFLGVIGIGLIVVGFLLQLPTII